MRDHLLVAALTLTVLACGGDPAAPCDTDGDCVEGVCLDGVCRPRSDGGGVDAGDAGRDRDAGVGDAGTCAEDCGDGTCIAGVCCDADRSCDGTCCGDAQVGSFNRCVDIGGPCSGEEDCGEGGYWCNGWAIFEGFIVFISWTPFLPLPTMPKSLMSVLRAFRALRVLRALFIIPGMKELIGSALQCIPQ